jgi:hypothetical protein
MAPKPNPFGQAIQNLVAEAVHKVVLSVLPHWHETRTAHTMKAMGHVTDEMRAGLQPFAAYCLDNDLVHEVLKPVFNTWAGR